MTTTSLSAIFKATNEARKRANDKTIGVRVDAGQFQVVRVTFSKRSSTVTELTGWGSAVDAVRYLNAIGQQ